MRNAHKFAIYPPVTFSFLMSIVAENEMKSLHIQNDAQIFKFGLKHFKLDNNSIFCYIYSYFISKILNKSRGKFDWIFRVWWIYQKFYIGTVFGGTVLRAMIFGLLAALKITPQNRTQKTIPLKNCTPKNAQKWAFLKTAPLNP